MGFLLQLLGQRSILILLLIVNVFGTIYGYIWYMPQLVETPPKFLPFVPDSPTASLFFVIVLIGFLLQRNFRLFEALALITLFKYGIWAVVMNLLVWKETGILTPPALMLIFSHLGMALQGMLYSPYYRLNVWHLVIAAIWTLHNDVIDYVFFMYPQYPVLDKYIPQIGYFTFWLSIVSISITYMLCIKKNRFELTLIK